MPKLYMVVKNWLKKLKGIQHLYEKNTNEPTNPHQSKRHRVHLKLRMSPICRLPQDGAILGKRRAAAFATPSVNRYYRPQPGQGTGTSWPSSGPALSFTWSYVITRSPRAEGWRPPNRLAVGVERFQ